MASFTDDLEDNEPENIWVACTNGDEARLRQLLQEGFSVNQQDEYGYSPIHAAASYGQVDLLRVLLSLGADVNIRDNEGDTPLLVCETPEVFELLVASGADATAVNTDGEGILKKAVDDDNDVLANFLVERFPHLAPAGFRFVSREARENDFEEWNQDNEEEDEGEGEEGEGNGANNDDPSDGDVQDVTHMESEC